MVLLLSAPAPAVDLTLGWEPNTEPNLAGYAAFIRKNAPPTNKHLDGHVALGDLEDPANPQYTFTGLQENTRYYIALKAYNRDGKYSPFSNPLCVDVGEIIQECASTAGDSGGGKSSDGGGGGGGCFIAAAAEGFPRPAGLLLSLLTAAPALLLLLRSGRRKVGAPPKE